MWRLFKLSLIICLFFSCKQKHDPTLTFNEIGWSLKLPDGFKLMDSSTVVSKNAEGKETIQSTTGKTYSRLNLKTIISATKNKSNYFTFSLATFKEKDDSIWQSTHQKIKELSIETAKKQMPNVQLDTSNEIVTIDLVNFKKFKIVGKINNQTVFNSITLNKIYKGYYLEISYLFSDENVGYEIEEMLKDSKFKE